MLSRLGLPEGSSCEIGPQATGCCWRREDSSDSRFRRDAAPTGSNRRCVKPLQTGVTDGERGDLRVVQQFLFPAP